jgi:exodeoxyribonuclease-3
MRIVSWNVNGYRAGWKKGFAEWLEKDGADVVGIQETKAWPEQLTKAQIHPNGYFSAFAQAEKKGYSGVATFSKEEADRVQIGFMDPKWDTEGRVVITEHAGGKLLIANIYFPNGQKNEERLQYKMDFYDKTLDYFVELKNQGKNIVVFGDYNTAHKEIDLARPKENQNTSGFLQIERDWINKWIAAGFVDTFRLFNQNPDEYSWWNMRTRARDRNVGWRIDYHFVSENMKDAVANAAIHQDIMGSDHCPLSIEVDVSKLK